MKEVAVIQTGVANNASVFAGLRRAGAEPRPARDAGDVRTAPAVMLPGVGSFGAGMGELRAHGFDRALVERIGEGLPTLAICLGLQMLFETSDEAPGERGLGVIPGHVGRFPDGELRVPQLGWNRVEPGDGFGLVGAGEAYFANSYRVSGAPDGWAVCRTEHGERFTSALRRGSVLACQFHPELSGAWGLGLMRGWLSC